MKKHNLSITLSEHQIMIADFPDSVSFENCDQIYETIKNIIDTNDQKDVVLDFAKIKYIDSSAIGKIIHISNLLRFSSRFFAIINIDPKILKILQSFRLNKLFYVSQDDTVDKNSIIF